ncbi:hypothetical protein OIDMADRAFT_46681 [Oidiodendron maius Zn]|uniref:Uncharacterized protein n=1 Tax=Oidiodendron maius (strain Zn) TaxID=913774 RepID=A0A0C3HUS4_OIDMZ|nr:hypothetical protein OIDMADRAFT_46681 [Oidiodendron maius Zn]
MTFPSATVTSGIPESTIPASVLGGLGITALGGLNKVVFSASGMIPTSGYIAGAAENGGYVAIYVLFDVDSCDPNTSSANQQLDFGTWTLDNCDRSCGPNLSIGKMFCITPLAAAVLAKKSQLSRLIVPKALLLPTAQTM